MALRPGDEVVDSLFGAATIIRETRQGYLIALEKPAGLKLDRARDALLMPDGSPVVPEAVTGAVMSSVGQTDTNHDAAFEARQAIDALRFGVVPPTHLSDLTLGHDSLVSWMNENLAQPGSLPAASAVYGPFGSGKSHAMAAIREHARQRGYLAMATEVDGQEISLSQPRELLASLLRHLSSSADLGGAAPLVALVSQGLDAGVAVPSGSRAELLRKTVTTTSRLRKVKRFDDIESLVERLLGSDPGLSKTDFKWQVREALNWDDYVALTYDPLYDPAPLVAHSPVDRRPYDFATSLIGYASIARHAGFQGLVVTIDELEVEAAMSTAAKWRKLLLFVAAMREELGLKEGIVGGLSLFLAAVGEGESVKDQVVDSIVTATTGGRYELAPWDDDDLRGLSERIHRLYVSAYNGVQAYDRKIAGDAFSAIDDLDLENSGRIRAFIRSYVAQLDLKYGPPAL